mmetsp:Transcript_2587/g.7478  ORF Transcript_2587/g.7478 Transcript_2587/m.7478 type:complete len:88 (-) Transcript_2587:1362-1625(-)
MAMLRGSHNAHGSSGGSPRLQRKNNYAKKNLYVLNMMAVAQAAPTAATTVFVPHRDFKGKSSVAAAIDSRVYLSNMHGQKSIRDRPK